MSSETAEDAKIYETEDKRDIREQINELFKQANQVSDFKAMERRIYKFLWELKDNLDSVDSFKATWICEELEKALTGKSYIRKK